MSETAVPPAKPQGSLPKPSLLKKVLRVVGGTLTAIVLAGALAWMFRADPMGPISGRELTGEERAYPSDWSFTDDHFTVALESRPDAPHSVTTICFVHEGSLYIPAQGGSGKRWTQYVVADPRVRIKVGDEVYPARADRVEDADPEVFLASAMKKYQSMADRADGDMPEDIWLFRIHPRP